jgi:hypothetical protein
LDWGLRNDSGFVLHVAGHWLLVTRYLLLVARCGSFDLGFGIRDFGLEKDGLRGAGPSIWDLGFGILDWKD